VGVPNAVIRAFAAAVPSSFVDGSYFASLYGAEEIARIDKAAGLDRRPRLEKGTSPIELSFRASRAALEFAGVAPSSVDAILLVTQTPEFVIPATACLLQERLEISQDAAAFDVNLGCSGYIYGLFLAASFVRSGMRQRVLVVAGDASTRSVNDNDRSTAPLFGDAYSATLVEARESGRDAFGPFRLGTDGGGWPNLIHAVGMHRFRDLEAFERAKPKELERVQDPRFVHMNGEEIFTFALKRVPPLVAATLAESGRTVEQLDYFVYHQANRFMLEQLRRKSKIPPEKFLYSISAFANTSSASIPLTICHALRGNSKKGIEALLAGFGVGYSWGAVVVNFDGDAVGPVVELEARS
jgi:3-oxoacyl-[acyl-carrier-protein] synthase-3